MNGAKALLETLKARGIKYLFGLPGSTEAPLLEALSQEPAVEFVLGLVEPVSVAMADGYARASRRPGVISLHTSVGTLSGASMLYNSWRDSVPVVAIVCHKPTTLIGRMGFTTTINTPEQVRILGKWSHQTLNASQIPEEAERAIHYALTAPQGPTFLFIPEDLLATPVPESALVRPSAPLRPVRPDARTVAEIARELHEARAPVFVAGAEISRGDAVELAVQLAEELLLPVQWELRRQMNEVPFPVDHPHFVGEYSHRHPLIGEVDVLFAVGANLFVEFTARKEPEIPGHVKLIHAHRNPREVGKLYPTAIGVPSDPAPFLADLLEAVRALGPLPPEQRERRAARLESYRSVHSGVGGGSTPDAGTEDARLTVQQVGALAAKVLPRDAIIVDESITSQAAFFAGYPPQVGGLFRSGGGSLGWGVPAALGVQMARPEATVVAVVGDGCFSFTPQALWTGVRQGLPVVVIVLRNDKYQAVQAGMERHVGRAVRGDRYPGIMIDQIDTCAIARGYGARAMQAVRADEFTDGLAEALKASRGEGRPVVIDVAVR